MQVMTLGAFGFPVDGFRFVVNDIRPDLFIDIRRRRGVGGREYAYANSTRLQAMLAELGIPYLHRPDLAPSDTVRREEATTFVNEGIPYRQREQLTEAFIEAYTQDVLDNVDSQAFMDSLPPGVESILLFCVEGRPEACHRSLLAKRLEQDLGVKVSHFFPGEQTTIGPGKE